MSATTLPPDSPFNLEGHLNWSLKDEYIDPELDWPDVETFEMRFQVGLADPFADLYDRDIPITLKWPWWKFWKRDITVIGRLQR